MDRGLFALPFAAATLVGMLICLALGRRLGTRWLARAPQGAMSSLNLSQGAIFSLYGLLLAFTFSGAASRYDARRHLIVEEANAIDTAYMRLELLPVESQAALRELFRKYLDSRLETYRRLPNIEAAKAELAKSKALQADIWTQAVAVTRSQSSHPDAAKMLLPALNEMIDIEATRTMATRMHPPAIIFYLLFVLALLCSMLAGHGMAASKPSWLHVTAFAVVTAIAVYTVLDIEYPRIGFFHLESKYDQMLVEVRERMK
jgi:hypothetical protein